MAVWNPDNVIITQKGDEILSKVQAGVGKITVSRVVTGGGYVPPSQLYKQTAVTNIKQEMDITNVITDSLGSEISLSITNEDLAEEYSLYQIGIYVTHHDYQGEVLYLIAQCDTDDPDRIPLPSVTVATLQYSVYMEHSGTDNVVIQVSPEGFVTVDMIGAPNGVASLGSTGKIPTAQIPVGYATEDSVNEVRDSLNEHIGNTNNPHGVTAQQIGAEPAGSASAVQKSLDAHIANRKNPHGVTAQQVGAVPLAGGTMTGPLTLAADPAAAMQAVTKQYFDKKTDELLPKSGGTLTGNLTGKYITGTWLQATADNHMNSAATKICIQDASGCVYHRTAAEIRSDIGVPAAIQTAIGDKADKKVPAAAGNLAALDSAGNLMDSGMKPGNFLPTTGGTMTGPITLAADPAAAMQPVTKQYFDQAIGDIGSALDAINGEVI